MPGSILDFVFGRGPLKKAAESTPAAQPGTQTPVTTPGVSQSDIAKMAQDQADQLAAQKFVGPRQPKPAPTTAGKIGDTLMKR